MLGDGLDTRDAEHDGLQLKACALEAMRFEPEHAPGDWRAASCVFCLLLRDSETPLPDVPKIKCQLFKCVKCDERAGQLRSPCGYTALFGPIN